VNVLLTYLTVVLATAVLGAWSIPLGLLLDLPPLGVYLAAVAGSLLVTVLVLTLGGRLRDLVERRIRQGREPIAAARAETLLARWGVPGLALAGGLLLGPTITLTTALVLDVPRRRFGLWYGVGTVLGFGVLTALWAQVL
jgi:membrane protein YqaA with SNARE-associated domain